MQVNQVSNSIVEKIKEESNRFYGLHAEVGKVIVGQENIITSILIAILSGGHVLLEGAPGVAKTTMIKTLTQALGLQFNRIQFTPDLLPSDVVGTLIYNPKNQDFEIKFGPIFSNLILADEINRAPAKVQAALLEAMEEHQVTIGSKTYKLEKPFIVFATQNPIEQEGTYKLPEAQVDRFMLKLLVDYPTFDQEKEILHKKNNPLEVFSVLTKEEIFKAQALVDDVYIDPKVVDYVVNIIFATRSPEKYNGHDIKKFIQHGASPRATRALYKASKAHAFLQKRHFVTPDDVKKVVYSVLRHRILLSYEAEAENVSTDNIISKILQLVSSP